MLLAHISHASKVHRTIATILNNLRFRAQGLGFKVQGLGFRAWSLGLRVSGLGFRV